MSVDTNTVGISFKETMQGSFALGITEPAEVTKLPSSSVSKLAMHADVTISDIDGFVSDPNHLGSLSGTIDFEPFGKGLVATKGVFNLFAPTAGNPETRMIYELGFEHNGKAYYLAGHKKVNNDAGFDIWSDTTTLYTTLYEGTSAKGTAVGAGILSLGITDLAKLVSTMNVTNADSTAAKATALSKFGKFFMGELWQTYGPKF